MIDYGLKGRVAVITGANNPEGIGAATALALAREGAKVVLATYKYSRVLPPPKADIFHRFRVFYSPHSTAKYKYRRSFRRP